MFSCKITGLGDVLLEGLLSVALEKTSNEVGEPEKETVGLLLSLVKRATQESARKETTVRLMSNVAQALKAAGWEDGRRSGRSKN